MLWARENVLVLYFCIMDDHNFFFIFWPCRTACEILFPQPGIEALPPALGAQSLNHWTAREVSNLRGFKQYPFIISQCSGIGSMGSLWQGRSQGVQAHMGVAESSS